MNRFRITAILVGLILLVAAAPVNASDDEGYLALGASFPFGFDPRVSLADRNDPEVFVGYPETLAKMLDLDVVNGACPGETSASFISLAVASFCSSTWRPNFPLHVDYTTSQLDFAITHLREHPETQLVTIEIGNNDLALLSQRCDRGPDPASCFQRESPAMLAALESNLKTIFARIRGEGGYHSELVMVNIRVFDYRNVTRVNRATAANRAIASATSAAGERLADIFEAFKLAAEDFAGDTCAAGLLIRLPDKTCDFHPSPAGRDLYARTVKAVVTIASKD